MPTKTLAAPDVRDEVLATLKAEYRRLLEQEHDLSKTQCRKIMRVDLRVVQRLLRERKLLPVANGGSKGARVLTSSVLAFLEEKYEAEFGR